MSKLLILGCGYSGLEIAKHWQKQQKGAVLGTTRNRLNELKAQGITPFDLADNDAASHAIKEADAIIISTPPPDPALRYINAIKASKAWLGYLSTTAVYGNHNGGWVDEKTPTQPTLKRAKLRLETEKNWREVSPDINIFRLAAIYGPKRAPFDKIREGHAQKIIKPGQVFGRIHVEDIARVILASFEANDRQEIYNLADDLPAPPEDVLDYAAKLLSQAALNPTPFEKAELSDMARSFYLDNKRVSNQKIRQRFGELLYPDYRAGLDAIHQL